MAKTDSEFPWGTWEELLLACAVNRYGRRTWDSVANEIQKRCSRPPLRHLITPKNCEQKYLDLKRRFTVGDDDVWLEELKKLRMAELKLELERYDLSIVSLQMKVKKLKEETEDPEKTEPKREPDEPSTELIAGKSNQSSNSSVKTVTTVKLEGEGEPVRAVEVDREPVRVVEMNREPDICKSNREGSCNGSSNSIGLVKTGNSDDPVLRGSSVCGEPQNGNDQLSVKSQQLVHLLEIVRSHKLCSVLTRQDSTEYRSIIRQYLDFGMLQKRLDEGLYSDGTLKFHRDLLVIINNALVFFRKKSSEYVAATEIRQLVTEQMARIYLAANSSTVEKVPRPTVQNLPLPSKKATSDSLLLEPKIPALGIFSKKRSSITLKKKDETIVPTKEKKEKKTVDKSEENQALKKQTGNLAIGSRNDKKSGKNPNNYEESSDHKKNKPNRTGAKKQGAASFLNRLIKKTSPSGNMPLIENKRSGKKKVSPKKVNGRPPKRAVTPPIPVSGKRSREGESPGKQAKKKTRK